MTHYKHICRTGCGHTTIIDKFYKRQRAFCGICGTRSTMEYMGEVELKNGSLDLELSIEKIKHYSKQLERLASFNGADGEEMLKDKLFEIDQISTDINEWCKTILGDR
ncbi:hypothetical protein C3Z10_11540 [Bacillus velezensis]|uniref:Uncharacterized protein n=3 Tax=Bacillus TaxID=1386 RepID=A0ABC8DA28_BACVE|nr:MULTISPECIES: hypothetical protein [Bacillus]ANB49298.1 hypothetical protein A1D33_018590 [Bacillus velezensis]AVI28971.1 hypothetical protein C3Z10_11540 [Bacillus velezensis]AWX72625.1 hypothetical protein BVDSYZ_11565 [Bacillus velezensis]MBR7816794.1 hypothetical protein [Bacillus sp. CCNWLCWHY013]MCX4184229.1 hypothetical protein [Bacillus amyloliquefaciens]